jgi:hemerythrin
MVNRVLSSFSPTSPAMPPEFAEIRKTQHALRRRTQWLLTCPDDHVPNAYLDVVRTTEHMFCLEQELMESFAFPVRQLHLEQHARVLRGLHCVHGEVMRGATDRGRHTGGRLLMDWLHVHQNTLDAAFDIWVDYCRNGLIDPHSQPSSAALMAH